MIILQKVNEVYVKVLADQSILKDIASKFEFYMPSYEQDWRFKNGWWNGKSTIFNTYTKLFYIGLLPKLTAWFDEIGYEYRFEGKFNAEEFSVFEATEFIKTIGLPDKFEVRDYQLKYFVKMVRNHRGICLSPTSSGKSLIIYLLFRYFNEKTLLIVPSINLVKQMYSDFKEYGYDVESNVHFVYQGIEKTSDKLLIISTWQSIYEQKEEYFKQFKVVIGDEAHHYDAKSVARIMARLVNASVRIGLTGTLTAQEYKDHMVEGLFGPPTRYITTKELIDQGYASDMIIKGIVLNHVESPFRDMYLTKPSYEDELAYLLQNKKRNKFIRNLALSLEGNTFVMFRVIDHGKELYELIKEKATCPVYFVDGSTSATDRETLRKTIQGSEKSITVASTVFATGVNITSISNLIFTHPSKSRIRVLQSIGRGLRKHVDKSFLTLFDIADDLTSGSDNITLRHFVERVKLYREEKFDQKHYKIDM